ncbi:MAG: hypothetical protein KAR13_17120, partial [Desulfobulbaceae bacterium]|nr:hypothetical protein [Desulfobulbaceae bacterium]
IAATNYEYTSSIKVYDSQGASHDITVYFDRTMHDNEWEFLVTCEPAEDMRNLDPNDPGLLANYAPDDTYNYENHKGAGALMYGTINYNTSGEITRMNCWKIPPDGKVDPALNDNRIILNTGDSYYSFECNFTGATTNQEINFNIGARWNGARPSQEQIIVSDGGAFSDNSGTTYITEETLWGSVHDSGGNVMVGNGGVGTSDIFTLAGYDTVGVAVPPTIYRIETTAKVSDFLTDIEATFGCSAAIDAKGRLKLTDQSGEPYMLAITDFDFTPLVLGANNPFKGIPAEVQINITTSKQKVYSPDRGLTSSGTPIDANTLWESVEDSGGTAVGLLDTFQFDGNKGDGTAVLSTYPPVPLVSTATVGDFLTWMENEFDCEAEIDTNGRLVLTDRVADESGGYSSALEITNVTYGSASTPWGSVVAPATMWDFIPSDEGTEDGSIEGGTINDEFASEALASTQY